jgi:tryptophan synthase alpha chain
MSRIEATFAALKAQNKTGLVTFITAGDPAPEMTVPLMHALVAGGADVLELGVPFSDPMAEGPVIQRACERALRNSASASRTSSTTCASSARPTRPRRWS